MPIMPPSFPTSSNARINADVAEASTSTHRIPTGPVLAATDGRATADPALIAAGMLAQQLGADVRVFSVMEPLPKPSDDGTFRERCSLTTGPIREGQRTLLEVAIQTQLLLTCGTPSEWPLTIHEGPLGPTSRQIALDTGAQAITIARHRHSMMGRVLGQDSMVRILEWATTPVYIALESSTTIATRAVVGIDFSSASLQAARYAERLLAEDGTLYLVHVYPLATMRTPVSLELACRIDEARHALAEIRRQLPCRPGIQVQPIVLFGTPAAELLAFAEAVHATLVAAGTRAVTPPRALRNRLHRNSVALQLIDRAPCPILVVPDRQVRDGSSSSNNRSLTAS